MEDLPFVGEPRLAFTQTSVPPRTSVGSWGRQVPRSLLRGCPVDGDPRVSSSTVSVSSSSATRRAGCRPRGTGVSATTTDTGRPSPCHQSVPTLTSEPSRLTDWVWVVRLLASPAVLWDWWSCWGTLSRFRGPCLGALPCTEGPRAAVCVPYRVVVYIPRVVGASRSGRPTLAPGPSSGVWPTE